jgi:NhaA family Na+:H+ antiporter
MRERDDRIRPPWSRSDRPIPRRLVRPLQEFVTTSAAAAFVLVPALVVALAWANGPWGESYERFWSTGVFIGVGEWTIAEDLRFWVSEGLMTLFFLVAGLEIKRELSAGELRDRRAAAIPVIGAIGGMVGAGIVFAAITLGTPAAEGWGAALPTDLAFGLAILVIAARSAPLSLRPFLLSLAIVDDLLTVAVVCIFYAESVRPLALVAAAVCVGAMLACERLHIRYLGAYLVLGVIAWFATYRAGVHPALVGAVLGFLSPAAPFQRPVHVSEEAHRIADETSDDPEPPDADAEQWFELAWLSREAVSPLARVEHALVPWVNLVALPLFALANAGVKLTGGWAQEGGLRLVVAFVGARLIGKTAGVAISALGATRHGLGRVAAGVGLRDLVGVGAAAGAPFTVSLFVATVAFPAGSPLRAATQIGVLLSLGVCAAVSFAALRRRAGDSARAARGRPR